ncbi:MAG: ABC transporter permease [Anaerolineaceae bacterium]|nr:ABC transporter permease [Anaerolineaceae bacterium]
MWRRLWALTQKELIQLIRDRRTLILVIVGSAVEVFLFAAGVHTDIKNIAMVVADQSQSTASRQYLTSFTTSGTFNLVSQVSGEQQVVDAIDSGQASIGLIIPPNFADQLLQSRATVMMLLDGTSTYTTQSAYNAANSISQQYAVSLIGQNASSPLTLHTQILYNPDLIDLWFILPAMMIFMLQAASMNFTSLCVVREREIGTIEAILVTPIRPLEFMIAKSIPQLLVSFTMGIIFFIEAVFIIGIPFLGNILALLIMAFTGILCGLGLGLVISTAVQTQNQSYQLSGLINVSAMFLGGIFYPNYTLPWALRWLGYIFPSTYFVPIVRGMFLKGISPLDLWPQTLGMVLLLVATFALATRLFRQSLD